MLLRASAFIGDSTGIGGLIYEPLTLPGFAAACTSRIRLGTMVLVLPLHSSLATIKRTGVRPIRRMQ